MKLHEIIDLAYDCKYIPFEEIKSRKKQLLSYFNGLYNSEVVIFIWNVTNTGGCATIGTIDSFYETIEQILINYYPDLSEDEREDERELINFNSMLLKDI